VEASGGSRAGAPDGPGPGSRASGEAEDPAPAPSAELLRALPSVEELASRLGDYPHGVAVTAARDAIGSRREAIVAGDGRTADAGELEADARRRAGAALQPRLRPVVNATGVIVHTNLGRAPLPASAIDAVADVARGYSNLEYELEEGRRGSRHAHVEDALLELTGAAAATVVNNCAAAVLLATAALAAGREVVVSRGQLVEIGGSFRIPEVVEQSGARLVEVGTTNRTRPADYERAIGADTGALLRAHPSNFRAVGFTEEVPIEELCELAGRAGVPVIDDAGSGALAASVPELADEPAIRRSIGAGCALVCFSGDKLMGGPQAGVVVGTSEAVERCRRHPLARALRPDKMQLAALEATLALYREPERASSEIPVLRMLTAGDAELRPLADLMASVVSDAGADARVVTVASKAGGGSLPLLELEGPACSVDPGATGLDELVRRLRSGTPPVIGRAAAGRLVLDPRTLTRAEARTAADAVAAALG
jgi:L-seryl-tRNA(Ser) seleniumtransferase